MRTMRKPGDVSPAFTVLLNSNYLSGSAEKPDSSHQYDDIKMDLLT